MKLFIVDLVNYLISLLSQDDRTRLIADLSEIANTGKRQVKADLGSTTLAEANKQIEQVQQTNLHAESSLNTLQLRDTVKQFEPEKLTPNASQSVSSLL